MTDGTFWATVPYYDGMKLDPEWGVSWEQTWAQDKRLEVDTSLQLFFAEDRVNGSIVGADAESTDDVDEATTFVARVVPRWWFDANTSLAVGFNALKADLDDHTGTGQFTALSQYAVDVDFHWCGLRVLGEWARSNGAQNPAHYVTGGPSDIYDECTLGLEYKLGWLTLRGVWSRGEYKNPGGNQELWVVGPQLELTSWLALYIEYVHWTTQADGAPETLFEESVNFILNWHV